MVGLPRPSALTSTAIVPRKLFVTSDGWTVRFAPAFATAPGAFPSILYDRLWKLKSRRHRVIVPSCLGSRNTFSLPDGYAIIPLPHCYHRLMIFSVQRGHINMKGIIVTSILLLSAAGSFTEQTTKPDEKQAQPTLQQMLEQTCQSIKSGELANPQTQLADICRTYDDEQDKKKEQTKENMQFWSAKYCGAPWAPDSPQRAKLAQVLPKLLPTFQRQYAGQGVVFLVVKSPTINAWTIIGENRSLICVPTAMVDFLSGDGEVAFIMGHEMGHAVDQACKGPKTDMAVR